jgi:hypothetical protein
MRFRIIYPCILHAKRASVEALTGGNTMRNFVTAATAARHWHVPRVAVERQCRIGVFEGAVFDRVTWRWWVPRSIYHQIAAAFELAGKTTP